MEDKDNVAPREPEGPLSKFSLQSTFCFLRDILTPFVDAGIVVELQELERALSASGLEWVVLVLRSLDTGDMEAGGKPMYSCVGFSLSTVQWVDEGVDAADGPRTSRGSTVVPGYGSSS